MIEQYAAISIDAGQVDDIPSGTARVLKAVDEVIIAGANSRFGDVVKIERIDSQPTGHDIVAGAADQRVVAGIAKQSVRAAETGDDVAALSGQRHAALIRTLPDRD